MSRFRSRRFAVLAVASLATLGLVQSGAYGQGQPQPHIVVLPAAGLVNGQTVSVSGSGFQPNQGVALAQCGAEMMEPPFIGAVCTYNTYSVVVQADADGNFGPVNFTVTTFVSGVKWVKGHYEPASHTCAPSGDCYVHAYSTTRAPRSANQHLAFE